MRPILLPLVAFALALAPAARAAAPAAPHADHATAVAALSAMPTPPKNYSVDMKIHADGKDITMTRAMNENGDMRMDIDSGEHGKMTMIQLNDEKKTMYMVSPERKEVIKQSRTLMMKEAGRGAAPPDKNAAPDSEAAAAGTLEKIGQEEVNGVVADKYKVTAQGMDGVMWIDPKTGLLSRMQAENGTIDFTNYKIGAVTAETLTPPKDYKFTDMDEMMSKMSGMGGMTGIGGMGGMGKNMLGGMAGGMGGLGGGLGGALGGMVGGPLGHMAGQFLGQRVGSALGHKVAGAAASKL